MLEDEFGDIIRKARTGQGKALAEVALMAGLDSKRLAALEAYQQKPTQAESNQLAEVLRLAPGPLWNIATGSWRPRLLPEQTNGLIIHSMVVHQPDGWASNCHLAGFEDGEEALVVDPGAEPERIMNELDRLGWRPRYVALTHGHRDHVGGVKAIMEEWGVCVLVNSAEIPLIGWTDGRFHYVKGEESLILGHNRLKVLSTPGHTPGGTSFQLDHVCFVGDALFAGSIGRANVPKVGYRMLLDSLRREVLSLPAETRLYPGHGPNTTVGEEREHNPFFP